MPDFGRVRFIDNPWPNGHVVADFQWTARLDPETGIWFNLHLETEHYHLEQSKTESCDIELKNRNGAHADWYSAIVWNNYHQAVLSSTQWGGHGFQVGTRSEPLDLNSLSEKTFHIDPLPGASKLAYEQMAFNIYLLGHDAVADHQIRFHLQTDLNVANIDWSGRIALAYTGDEEYRYQFIANVTNARFRGIRLPKRMLESSAREILKPLVVDTEQFIFDSTTRTPSFRFA